MQSESFYLGVSASNMDQETIDIRIFFPNGTGLENNKIDLAPLKI